MRSKYTTRFQEDFKKYAKQIGIMDDEMPILITDRKEIWRLKEARGENKSTAAYGECDRENKIIFVDTHIRKAAYKQYPMYKVSVVNGRRIGHAIARPDALKKKRVNYRNFVHVLVHELVHYRWKMGHGVAFEKRIKEILRGKVFPEVVLFANNTTQADNKSISIEPKQPQPTRTFTKEEILEIVRQALI
jgi:hypothetical protein